MDATKTLSVCDLRKDSGISLCCGQLTLSFDELKESYHPFAPVLDAHEIHDISVDSSDGSVEEYPTFKHIEGIPPVIADKPIGTISRVPTLPNEDLPKLCIRSKYHSAETDFILKNIKSEQSDMASSNIPVTPSPYCCLVRYTSRVRCKEHAPQFEPETSSHHELSCKVNMLRGSVTDTPDENASQFGDEAETSVAETETAPNQQSQGKQFAQASTVDDYIRQSLSYTTSDHDLGKPNYLQHVDKSKPYSAGIKLPQKQLHINEDAHRQFKTQKGPLWDKAIKYMEGHFLNPVDLTVDEFVQLVNDREVNDTRLENKFEWFTDRSLVTCEQFRTQKGPTACEQFRSQEGPLWDNAIEYLRDDFLHPTDLTMDEFLQVVCNCEEDRDIWMDKSRRSIIHRSIRRREEGHEVLKENDISPNELKQVEQDMFDLMSEQERALFIADRNRPRTAEEARLTLQEMGVLGLSLKESFHEAEGFVSKDDARNYTKKADTITSSIHKLKDSTSQRPAKNDMRVPGEMKLCEQIAHNRIPQANLESDKSTIAESNTSEGSSQVKGMDIAPAYLDRHEKITLCNAKAKKLHQIVSQVHRNAIARRLEDLFLNNFNELLDKLGYSIGDDIANLSRLDAIVFQCVRAMHAMDSLHPTREQDRPLIELLTPPMTPPLATHTFSVSENNIDSIIEDKDPQHSLKEPEVQKYSQLAEVIDAVSPRSVSVQDVKVPFMEDEKLQDIVGSIEKRLSGKKPDIREPRQTSEVVELGSCEFAKSLGAFTPETRSRRSDSIRFETPECVKASGTSPTIYKPRPTSMCKVPSNNESVRKTMKKFGRKLLGSFSKRSSSRS